MNLSEKFKLNEDVVSFSIIIPQDEEITTDLLDEMIKGFIGTNKANKIFRSIMFSLSGGAEDKFVKHGKAKSKSDVKFEVFVNEKYAKDKKEVTFKVIS